MSIRPQPKRRRPQRRIDYTALAIPKTAPVRDADYRKWVRDGGGCMLPHFEVPCGTKPDRVPTECCHLPYSGVRGMGLKAPDVAFVRLCPVHHDALDAHTIPWQIVAFLWAQALFLREAWHRSGA